MSSAAVFEHSFYIGNYMSAILYGVELAMYFSTLQCILRYKPWREGDMFFALYSTALLVLLTIDISCNAVWGEQLWITSRDMPGGQSAFMEENISVWYQALGTSSFVGLVFLGDALLLYRCFILWNSDYRIIFLPLLVYLTAFALGIVNIVGAFTPGGNFFNGRSVVIGIAYYSMTIALNVLVTLLICGRLLYLSRLMRSTLGEENSRLYTNIAAIMAESAVPYTLVGLMFIVPYATGSPTAIAFGQVWGKLACISPQLIVLRVLKGRAWGKDTVHNAKSSLEFHSHMSSGPTTATQISDFQGTRDGGDPEKKLKGSQQDVSQV